jgi:serine/threonine-protein kinase HipA
VSVRLCLDVWLDGFQEPVGQLEAMTDNAIRFRYAARFLDRGRPISLSLPLQEEAIGDRLARPFFDNLLPENDQMQRVIDQNGLDRSDIVAILAHVGADCAGAISCLPAGSPKIKVPGGLAEDYHPLETDELAEIARRLAARQPLPGEVKDPSPIAGVQPKIALTRLEDGRFALPAEGRKVPTTHILKVPRRSEASDAIREEAVTRLASACGFEVSTSRHVTIGDSEAVLIERFDRVVVDGYVYRLHQEDFAQALGLPATLKYERNGTPERRFDTRAVRSVLERLANPAKAFETFLLSTFFNLAIGNNDNHAKNYGILYDPEGLPRLAPLYDLLPVKLNRNYTEQLAFNVGEAIYLDQMRREDVATMLDQFGLSGRRAERFIQGPVRAMLETLEQRARLLRGTIELRMLDDLIGRELGTLSGLLDLRLNIAERDYFGSGGGGWAAS